jgi:hypothetical protein
VQTSTVPDGATAVGQAFDTPSYVTAGAKLLSLRNGTVEKAYVDKDGGLVLSAGVTATGVISVNGSGAFTGNITVGSYLRPSGWGGILSADYNPLLLIGTASNGSSAVGVILDNNATLSIAGSKLLSIRNNAAEKASFDKDGNLAAPYATYSVGVDAGPYVVASQFIGKNTSGYLLGQVADGATAVGSIIGNNTTFNTAGAKIVSFRNYLTEKSFIDKDGTYWAGGGAYLGTHVVAGPAGRFYGGATYPGILNGQVTDGATAVATVMDNPGALTTAGAKITSFRNAGIEKAYIDKDGIGSFAAGNTTVGNNIVYANQFSANSSGLGVHGSAADGASAVGIALNNLQTLSTAGAKLLSVRNNNVEKAYFTKDGDLVSGNTTIFANGNIVAGTGGQGIQASYFYVGTAVSALTNGVTLNLRGVQNDGVSAVGVTINNQTALVTAGAKILSIQNAGAEKAYIDKDGQVVAYGYYPIGNTAVKVGGLSNDGASAVGVSIDNYWPLSTAGAKIASFRNGGVEKAFVDLSGNLALGSLTATGTTSPTNITLGGSYSSVAGQNPKLKLFDYGGAASTVYGIGVSAGSMDFINPTATGFTFYVGSTAYALINSNGVISNNAFWGNGIYGTFVTVNGVATLPIKGTAADGAAAVGVVLDNTTSLVTAGSKITSFRNAGAEQAYITRDGAFVCVTGGGSSVGASIVAAGQVVANNGIFTTTGAGTNLKGQAPDGASAVGVTLNNSVSLVTPGAKLLSVQNNGAEKAYIDKDGSFYAPTGYLTAYGVVGASASYLRLVGGVPDGATAIGVKIGNGNALATAGAKIVSFYNDNNTTEKAAITYDGGAYFSGVVNLNSTVNVGNGNLNTYNIGCAAAWTTPLIVRSSVQDGSSAVAFTLNNQYALATSGAKLLSVQNNGTEKAYISYDGTASFSGGGVFNGGINTVASPVTTLSVAAPSGGDFSLKLAGYTQNFATSVAVKIATSTNQLTTAGAKIVSFYNDNYVTEKAFIDKDGGLKATTWTGVLGTVTYSASMTPDASVGDIQGITITDATAFTINAPTNAVAGRSMTLRFKNTSAGTSGAGTFNAVFKMASFAAVATATSTLITFFYDGTNWIEMGRVTGIPN